MTRRRAVTLLVLLAMAGLIAGGWLAWDGEPEVHARAGAEPPPTPETAPPGDEGDQTRRPISLGSPAQLQRDRFARTGTLEGMVLDAGTGEPVAEAELTFSRDGSASSTMTSLAGDFLFRASEPGGYELATVTAEGYLPFAPEWGHSPIRFNARAGIRITGIVISLEPSAEYVGRVVGPEGNPVAGAEVTILGAPSGQTALVPLADTFVTDEAGEVRAAAPDWALVEARREGYSPGRTRIDMSAQITRRFEVRLLPPGQEGGEGFIGGIVVDPRGNPVSGALVAARSSYGMLRTFGQTVTDLEGRFFLEELDEGRYFVEAERDGLAPGRAHTVPTGTEDLRLVLSAGGTLVGAVVEEPSRSPVPSFNVIVERRLGPLRRSPYRTETVFDAEGRFEIEGVEPGRYAVLITAHGYAPSEPVDVELGESPGGSARANFALSRGGAVTGVVTSAGTGEAVAGARVTVEATAGPDSSPVPITARTVTDGSGRFTMAGLASGLRSIVVTATDHHRRIVSGLRVAEGGDVGPVDIELTPLEGDESPSLELTGIGAVLTAREDGLLIVRLVPEGGAVAAGLRPGDLILAVDGLSTLDIGFEGSIERIRGLEGTQVRLTIRRHREEASQDVLVARTRVRA